MVVDPGCMKCMDCVSVCPKEALSFSFGKPAAGRPKASSVKGSWDLSLAEESFVAIFTIFAFYAVYFPFGESAAKVSLPLLFASGVAACAAFMAWKFSAIMRGRPTGFHRWNLVRGQKVSRAGWIWVALTVLLCAGLTNTMATNIIGYAAFRQDLKVQVSENAVYASDGSPRDPSIAAHARTALALYKIASSPAKGGISIAFPIDEGVAMRRAWLHAVLGEFDSAEAILRSVWAAEQREPVAIVIGRVIRASGRHAESDRWFIAECDTHPDWLSLQDEHRSWLVGEDRLAEAIALVRARSARAADRDLAQRRLSMLLIDFGTVDEVEEGLAITRESLATQEQNPFAHAAIATALFRLKRPQEAIAPLRRAIELAESTPQFHEMLAQALEQTGDVAGATIERARASELGNSGGQ